MRTGATPQNVSRMETAAFQQNWCILGSWLYTVYQLDMELYALVRSVVCQYSEAIMQTAF